MSKARACGAACDCNLSISSCPRRAETHSHRPLIVLPRLMLVICSSLHWFLLGCLLLRFADMHVRANGAPRSSSRVSHSSLLHLLNPATSPGMEQGERQECGSHFEPKTQNKKGRAQTPRLLGAPDAFLLALHCRLTTYPRPSLVAFPSSLPAALQPIRAHSCC